MLEVQHIGFSAGHKALLQDVSFASAGGEFIAVLGANGAGKSTLLKLIAGELRPSSGHACWNQQSIHHIPSLAYAKERAVLTQKISVNGAFPVFEIVMMGRYPHFKHFPTPADHAMVEEKMQQTETTTLSVRNYQTLSGGEQQRVQLARTLCQVEETGNSVQGKKLLLLDEPLNNLDIKHQHQCLHLAKEWTKKGNIVVAVLHDINLAIRYSDQLLFLKDGKAMGYGKPAEIVQESLIAECFNYPSKVMDHPFLDGPIVYFDQGNNYQVTEIMDHHFIKNQDICPQ